MRRVNLRNVEAVAPEGAHVEIVQDAKGGWNSAHTAYVPLAGVAPPAGFVSPVVATGVNQGLSGTGALDAIALDSAYTGISTVGGAATTTLAAGTVTGQIKSIEMLADAGDCVITVAGSGTGSLATLTLNDVGDACTVLWNGTGWFLQTNSGCGLTAN